MSQPRQFDEDTLTDEVAGSFAATPDARLRLILQTLVRHLHDAARELHLTLPEWQTTIDFLTATGQACTDTRQEFVLLSDVLGISSLVENLNHEETPDATDGTVLGPFHMVASPVRQLGDSIDEVGRARRVLVSGRVLDPAGQPLAGATVDVWQADENGFYDVQVPDRQPLGNGRGLFRTDEAGRFWFLTIVPSYYPIPVDGPVGTLLAATKRHPYRPAHIHFIAQADGYAELTTHIFVSGSPYLDSDAVFAVKESLIRSFDEHDDPTRARELGLSNPYLAADIDLVLQADPDLSA